MFITKIPVSLTSPTALATVACRQASHLAVAAALPPLRAQDRTRGRTLWRLLATTTSLDVIVVSPEQPDIAVLSKAFGSVPGDTVSRPYDLGAAVVTDAVFRFDVEANPAFNVRKATDKTIRRAAEGQSGKLNWLAAQASRNGFTLDRTPECATDVVTLRRPEGESSIVSARFRGDLRVTDPDRFLHALFNGVGRAKAFGFGMILLSQ